MSKVDENDLGDHAEGLFDLWCREAGALATPPRKDKVGWDFYVVLPDPCVSLSDAPPRLNCSVQVKAQWNTTKQGPQIKLSNWKSMILDPNPWFVFVLIYERPKQPVRGVLVHVDEKWTGKAMHRLWRNQAEKNAKASDLKMRLNWETGDILPSLDGETILQGIRNRIGDANRYVERKRRWVLEAGVGSHKYSVTVRFRNDDVVYEQLASAAIGDHTSAITFPSVEIADIRFGISIPQAPAEAGNLSFVPHPSSSKAKAIFTSIKPVREQFSIEFDVFSSTSVIPLPKKYRKLRLVSALLRLEIAFPSDENWLYRWTLRIEEDLVSLADLVSAARAMRVLLDPESPPCTVELFGESLTIDAKARSKTEVSEEVLQIVDAAIYAGIVARSFGHSLETLYVTPGSLAVQRNCLQMLAALLGGPTADISLKITEVERDLDGQRVGHATVQAVRIGKHVLMVSIGFVGIARRFDAIDGALSVTPTIRVLERRTVPADVFEAKDAYEAIIHQMMSHAEATLDNEGIHVLFV